MSEDKFLQTLARYSGDIRTGAIAFDYRTGQCAPGMQTVPMSWGSACPPGYCPPDNLPERLGRWFAGDRSGCKELPYGINIAQLSDVALDTPVTFTTTSKVTMCPTRMIIGADTTDQWLLNTITFGNQNQLIGGPVRVEVFGIQAFQTVPMVPDCLRAGQPFELTFTLRAEAVPAVREVHVVFIGPTVG